MFDFTHLGIQFLVVNPGELKKVDTKSRDNGQLVRSLEVPKRPTKAKFMKALGVALSFPDYFGKNWDAVDECITELRWFRGNQLSFRVTKADRLLELDCLDFVVLVKVLARASKHWNEQGKSFQVVLYGSKRLFLTVNAILTPL